MKKLIMVWSMLFAVSIGLPMQTIATEVITQVSKKLRFIPKKDGTVNHPQKPASSPVYGNIDDSSLEIWSTVEGMGYITIENAAGETIIEDSGELSTGLTITLPSLGDELVITVVQNGLTYISTL